MEGRMKAALGSLVLMLAVIASVLAPVCDAQDTGIQLRICHGSRMTNRDTRVAWAQATGEVMDQTADVGYHHKAARTVNGHTVWSIGACNGRLDQVACTRCIGTSMNLIADECNNAIGLPPIEAQIKLVDCRLRWETYHLDWQILGFRHVH